MGPDAFDVLGLPAVFDLPSDRVERSYLRRVALLHPDVAGDEAEIQARSAELNLSRDVLRDPERRANALLRRLGGADKSADRSLPDGFLMDILETREAIEEATRSRDPAEVERWRSWARERRGEYIDAVSGLFRAATAAGPSPGELGAIRRELNAWRYIERLIEQLDPEYDPAKSDGV